MATYSIGSEAYARETASKNNDIPDANWANKYRGVSHLNSVIYFLTDSSMYRQQSKT